MEAPCHSSWSGGQVDRKKETCRRLGKCCFSGKLHLPFIPQIVESRTSLGSLLSAHTTPNLPKAIPLGHLRSASWTLGISSIKPASSSCCMRDLVIDGSWFQERVRWRTPLPETRASWTGLEQPAGSCRLNLFV